MKSLKFKIITSILLSLTLTTNAFANNETNATNAEKDQNISTQQSVQPARNSDLVSINAKAYGYYIKGNYNYAFAIYKRGLRLYPNSASLYDGVGAIYLKKKQFNQAYQNFNTASQLDNANSVYKIHAHEAIYKLYISKLNLAKYLISKAYTFSPYNPVIVKNFEDIRENKLHSLEMIYYVSQNLKDINLSKGNDAFWKKDFNKAEQFYQKSIKLRPKNYEALNNIGLAYLETGSINKAIANFKKAANLNPKLAQSYNNLGVAYSRQNKYNEANKNFDMSVTIGKNYFPAFNNKAVSLVNSISENIELSIKTLDTIVKQEPSNILAKQSLSQLLSLNEDYTSAINVYKSGLDLAQDNYNFLKQYAGCLYSANQYQESINYYKKAASINTRDSDIFVNLAKAQEKNGDNQNAFASYQTALRLNPKNAYAYKYFGLYLLNQKRTAEAKGLLQKYIELSPQNYECPYIKQLI